MMEGARRLPRLSFGAGGPTPGQRSLPEEMAVALTFNGSTQAVMMATPADLIDFVYGFALTEGIATPDEIDAVEILNHPKGMEVQAWLSSDAEARLGARRRTMTGPVGCGLCGIDSLDQALREMAPVPSSAFSITQQQIMAAIAALPGGQPLQDATRAVHAAGFWTGTLTTREDVGRHNALDKLAGYLARQPAQQGAVLLTSRVSIDMVQKVAAMGQPMLIAISAPTAQAVELAEACNITLIALARPDRFEVFTHSDRIRETADVG
ncbi:MAG: formate dehydrogenase accessory sulfurtransferase FdhD [Paracoccaceae bacterium]